MSAAAPKGPATWSPAHRKWLDADGVAILGPAPLAQLGVGGQYVAPQDGRTYTIAAITQETDEQGRTWLAVRAVGVKT